MHLPVDAIDASSPEMYVFRQICVHYSAIIFSNPTQLSPLILAVQCACLASDFDIPEMELNCRFRVYGRVLDPGNVVVRRRRRR